MILNNVVYGGPALKVPAHLSFGQLVIDSLRKNSADDESIAMINGDTGEKTTYKQILKDVVNIATGLAKIGVKRGDVVALCSENRIEFLIAALGAICCGATITTVNIMYTKDEFIHVLGISRPSVIFCSETALKLNLSAVRSVSCIKRIIQLDGSPVAGDITTLRSVAVEADPYRFEPASVQGWTDVVFILYSSGTTGLPKGVMLTHLNALYAAAHFDTDDDGRFRLLSIAPWYHAYGLMSTVNYMIVKKFLVYFSAGFNPERYLSVIQEYKLNVLVAVPPIVVFLAKSPMVENYDLSTVEMVWCGAAPLSADTIDAAMKRMPNCKGIYQAYGMTETSLAATSDLAEEDVKRKPGSAGYPLAGVTVKVVDIETREKLGANQRGEICLKGPIVMKGYAGNDAATSAMLDEEGYLKTGDIGFYDDDGCFFIVDRLKELIKYKGHQVAPAAVESVILQHSGVAECGVVGTPDEQAGELPTAFVVPKPGARLTERDLLDFTASRLSAVSQLHGGVIFVNDIPKNPSGKILRRVLKQRLLEKRSKL